MTFILFDSIEEIMINEDKKILFSFEGALPEEHYLEHILLGLPEAART
jgi:hypothetical protein